jgi:hypothetical protein
MRGAKGEFKDSEVGSWATGVFLKWATMGHSNICYPAISEVSNNMGLSNAEHFLK